ERHALWRSAGDGVRSLGQHLADRDTPAASLEATGRDGVQKRGDNMIQDAQGHHLSGATEAVAATYDQAVRAFNLVHGDAIGLFDAALQAVPDFAMAHLGKAWAFTVANDP